MNLMRKSAYAAHRGVGKSAVSNWAKRDLLVLKDGLVDVVKTDAVLGVMVDQSMGRPRTADVEAATASAGVAPIMAGGGHRGELIREQVIRERRNNAEKFGELVSAEEALRRAAEAGRKVRERVLAVVRTQAERLAAERDSRAIANLLTEELERVFAEVADGIESEASEPETPTAAAAPELETA